MNFDWSRYQPPYGGLPFNYGAAQVNNLMNNYSGQQMGLKGLGQFAMPPIFSGVPPVQSNTPPATTPPVTSTPATPADTGFLSALKFNWMTVLVILMVVVLALAAITLLKNLWKG